MKRASFLGFLMGAAIAVASCTSLPTTTGEPDPVPGWSVVEEGEQLGGAVLAAWGAQSGHMVFVGGPVGNGAESMVYVWSGGGELKRHHPGGTETFWWVHGTASDDVWMTGEHGRIVHFDGTTFEEQPRVVDTTIWGLIAFARNDVWAVGGLPGRPGVAPDDIVLHYDGTNWTQETLPGDPRNVALLKVWGASANDLYVVGERGTLWHRTASGWTLQDPPLAPGTLFSVHGCDANNVYAVGGNTVLKGNGTSWEKLTVEGVSNANGVFCTPDEVVIVGFGGLKIRLRGTDVTKDSAEVPFLDLHASFVDADGTIWVVGGDWLSQAQEGAPREGVIGRYGVGRVDVELVQ